MAKGPLRDWKKESYDDKGRAICGLDPESAGHDKQLPKLPKAGETYNASGSGDSGRRNK